MQHSVPDVVGERNGEAHTVSDGTRPFQTSLTQMMQIAAISYHLTQIVFPIYKRQLDRLSALCHGCSTERRGNREMITAD